MSEAILRFNGHRHAADKVLGKASVPVEVVYKDINADLHLVGLDNVGDPMAYYTGTPVFIKFEGKFVPLLGRSEILRNTTDPKRIVKGLLITSVALKATRLDDGLSKPAGPVTLKTPSEDVRVSQPEHAPLKHFDALRERFSSPPPRSSAPRPIGDAERRQINQNYGGNNRPESATGSSLRSRSPYRSTQKRNGV
jgi:hypothetical protein